MSHQSAAAHPSASARREAAVWIARIHSPDRAPHVEAGLRRWLEVSPENKAAFELANEMWEVASRIPENAVPRVMRWKRILPKRLLPLRPVAAILATAMVLAVVTVLWVQDPAIATKTGEQRSVTLEDGTRIALNTRTRIVVRYTATMRSVELDSGEALFDVARDAERPFVVSAGNRQIRVLGTSFVVRYESHRTAVTLVEGKVSVSDRHDESGESQAGSNGGIHNDGAVTLSPGQRLVFMSKRQPVLDQPEIERVTAWQRGLVALDHTPLADAVAEMNRYSAVQLAIGTPQAAAAKVSGVFRAGDSVFFAQAIARTYRLAMKQESGRIVLSGVPRETF